MRLIAHISDVHFGREDSVIVTALVSSIAAAEPDVVAISGDLTQRARVKQFKKAQEFIRALPRTPIVVPGNHDISATNLFERFARPLARFRRYISEDLEPFYRDDEMAIVGLNTVRVLSRKNGRINRLQAANACTRFHQLDSKIVRVVVTHHPLDLVETNPESLLVGRAAMAMAIFADCKVDLFLSGHLHTGDTVATSARYPISGYSAIVAQAGTAISTRTRGEANSWNLIRVAHESISVKRMFWNPIRLNFDAAAVERFRKSADGWALQAGAIPSPAPQQE